MEINGASRPRLMRCQAPQIVRPRMYWRVEMQGRSPRETLEPLGEIPSGFFVSRVRF